MFTESSPDIGNCDYCHSKGVPVLHPSELLDYLELITSLYVPDTSDAAILLCELLQKDWLIFSDKVLDQSANLLKEILDDDTYYSGTFSPSSSSTELPIEEWNAFRSEIMCNNRFILNSQLDLEKLNSLFNYLMYTKSTSTILYRARIQSGKEPFSLENMGMPPANLVGNGRANPVGIPYL